MLRSGFLLGVGGPAAILTLLVLPSVRASADRLVIPPITVTHSALPTAGYVPPYQPGARMLSFDVGTTDATARFATPPRIESRNLPIVPASTGPTAAERDIAKPRRMEGCEAPLSSLVGPEARRMVPGRCMA